MYGRSLTKMALLVIGILAIASTANAQPDADLERRVAALEAAGGGGGDGWLMSKAKSMFRLYGFVRVDTVYDDSEVNDTQLAQAAQSESGAAKNGDSDFTIFPRLTRIGLDFNGPDVASSKLTGKIEMDFFAFNTSDSRNELRMRHAYLKLARENCELLVGQTYDVISPLYPSVNADFANWNVGNTGDRRPQVRGTYNKDLGGDSKMTAAAAIAVQGAINGNNSDGDGVTDGEDAGVPQFQGRIGYNTKVGGRDAQIGIWGARGWEQIDGDMHSDYISMLYGLDLKLGLTEQFSLSGELWKGENVSDWRGGVGQGINSTTAQEIESWGGWLQGACAIEDFGSVFAGYTFDDPDRSDVPATTGITNNNAVFAGVAIKKWNPVSTGLEWTHFETRYRGGNRGNANRFRWYIAYTF